jgi:hypothetical protein
MLRGYLCLPISIWRSTLPSSRMCDVVRWTPIEGWRAEVDGAQPDNVL